MSADDSELDRSIADWLVAKEEDPELLPGAFASRLPAGVASQFLDEIEALAEVDAMASQTASRDLPRRIGDFRVLGELGRGAAGVVYEAEQVSTGRLVALKILHAHVAVDPTSTARFRREALAAASIEHPCIARIFDCGEIADVLWLTMERVKGHSLDRLIAAARDRRDVDHAHAAARLKDHQALARSFAETADALELAHRQHVVHRDLKPANLMVQPDGRLVVLDFGLASVRDGDDSLLTRTGDFLGTPLYMAPEQAIGAENGTARSDVYGLGAVLYEALTGEPPVARASFAAVVDSILNEEPTPPHLVRGDVPIGLSRIIMQCLEKDPARRYPTARALADDLRRFAAGQSVVARPQHSIHRWARAAKRRPLLSALITALILLVPVTWWIWDQRRESDRQIVLLQRDRDLARLPVLLAGAPEHITVFGGASLRHYARYGLAQVIPDGGAPLSAQARAALELADDLRRRFPADAAVLRARLEILLDVGADSTVIDTALEGLLTAPGVVSSDRAMAAVWHRRQGRHLQAQGLIGDLVAGDAEVDYWLGFWHQSAQQYDAAIEAFSRALRSDELGDEHRYFALLHRGWCSSCPEICQLRAAQDDLLQAAALRPAYGTAKLLWAALHCLEPDPDLGRAVEAVTEVLDGAEPWLHVLTARVLQALAEAGTWQSGPVTFGAEFSPIAAMPLPPARALALAGLSLQLLDGVSGDDRPSFEVDFHRIAGLALVGRPADALHLAEQRLASATDEQRAPLLLQCARVQLAAGRGQQALSAVERALDAAPDFVCAWRFAARLAAHLGDIRRELACVAQAARLLRRAEPQLSVFPDATALLPALELRRIHLLMRLGRTDEAQQLAEGDLADLRRGVDGPRVRALRAAELPRAGATSTGAPDVAADSPLRWLVESGAPFEPSLALASAARRGWLPDDRALPGGVPALEPMREALGIAAPDSIEGVGLSRLLPNAAKLASGGPVGFEGLMKRADEDLDRDPENGEARLMRGLLLVVSGRANEALEYLEATIDRFPNDLRARFVQACAAAAVRNVDGLRRALSQGDGLIDARALEGAAEAVVLPDAPRPTDLLAMLRE